MNTSILIVFFMGLFVSLSSCSDILTTEENYKKELIMANLSPEDSLKFLAYNSIDLGNMKIRTVKTLDVKITNTSDTHKIKIYSLENTNKTGLFSYSFPNGMPIELDTNSDTEFSKSISLKFISDSFVPDFYYDTLIINNNRNFYIPIKVKTYF